MKIGYDDFKTKRISDKLIFMLLFMGIPAVWLNPGISLVQRVSGFFVLSVPLLILACVLPGSIGGGDIKLMAAGGFLLGLTGILNAFLIGVLAAGCYVVVLLATKSADRKTKIALGPFLSLGIGIILLAF